MTDPHPNNRTVCVHVHGKRVHNLLPTTNPTICDSNSEVATHEITPSWSVNHEKQGLLDGAFKRYVPGLQAGAIATREEWLEEAVYALGKGVFAPAGHPLPQIKVTIGFPSEKGVSKKRRALGQCWPRQASDDGLNQVFLNPTLTSAEKFVGVLAHELVHAVDDCKSGHKGQFLTIRKSIGLTEGTPTSASAGAELKAIIDEICCDLGPLPHATLHPLNIEKKQSTRLLKVECSACGYTCRITAKWVEFGLPICPCGLKMVTADNSQILVRNRTVLNGGNHEKLAN